MDGLTVLVSIGVGQVIGCTVRLLVWAQLVRGDRCLGEGHLGMTGDVGFYQPIL